MKVGTVIVWQLRGQSAFFYKAGMTIDADGAPNAYHPQDIGLDFLANAGKPGNWWALVTGNGKPNGKPIVQGPSDPFPGYYVSTTALQDRAKEKTDPQRYIDSTKIPYLVLPKAVANKLGAQLGDFGTVINDKSRRLTQAIFADIGPAGKLGEGSIALAEALGIPSSPRRGGARSNVIYIVFPGSGAGKPRPIEEINTEAAQAFDSWGGMKQVATCFAE